MSGNFRTFAVKYIQYMKKNTIVWILIITWIACSIVAVLLINQYIEKKDVRLRAEIINNIEDIFSNQSDGNPLITFDDGLFDSPMNGGRVRNFKRANIPEKPNKADYENLELKSLINYDDILDSWKESYGDLASLWTLNWGSDDFREREDGGWHIVGIRCYGVEDSFIHTFVLFPYQVGLKKTEWGNYYTVPQAVSEAFEFYTTNPKSGISDRYERGSNNRIWSQIYDSKNEYYGIYKNENEHSWYSGKSIPYGGSPEEGGPIENGCVHNGYYRVYIAASQETHHGIIKHPWNPDIQERNKLYLWWLISLFLVFWIPTIIILISKRKQSKIKNESLKNRLLRRCSPSSFMSNYDKQKIDIANELYKEISKTDDEDLLITIADRVQQELSIRLIEDFELEDLKNVCNPSNYMKHYDAEKVTLANELYSILTKENISFSDFLNVKEQSKKL